MQLLDGMIACGRLTEFVNSFVDIHNEEIRDKNKELEEKTIWEIWLHRVIDKSFAEFRESLTQEKTAAPTPEEIKSTVMESRNILAGFVPDEGLVSRNGTVQTAGDNRR